jgi:hypothetical protein
MRLWLSLLVAMSIVDCAFAGPDYSVCETLVKAGLREFSIRRDSKENLDQLFTHYCSYSSSNNSTTYDYSNSALIYDIPETLTMGAKSSEQKIKNFCDTYKASSYSHETTDTYRESIAPKAYDAFEQCLKIVSHNVEMTHQYSGGSSIIFNIKASSIVPIMIDKVVAPDNVNCSGVVNGQDIDFKSKHATPVLTTQQISCSRLPNVPGDPESGYPAADITIVNNVESYVAYWPAIPSGAIKAQAKSELEGDYKNKYNDLKIKYQAILPASVTIWNWVKVKKMQTLITQVTCPTGWKPGNGGVGPTPLTHVFDTIVSRNSDGLVITGTNVAGGQENQVLIAYVECSPPLLE